MTLRSQLKTAAAWAVNRSGAGAFARARVHRDLPFIVGYHRVVARVGAVSALPAMEVSTAMLENHLDWIARHFRIISLDDIPGAMRQGRHAKPAAVITFDDGYSDVYHHAFPLLKRKGIPAGVFVVTDLVGTTKLPIHEEVYAALSNSGHADPFAATQQLLRTRPQADVLAVIGARDRQAPEALRALTWEMVREMRNAGISIGSHSKSHAFLANENAERIREETEGSRRELERRLGATVKAFAYPGGSFNRAVVEAVASAGYEIAFTDCRHSDPGYPLLTLPRRGLWEQSCVDRSGRFSPAILSCHSAALFDRFSRCSDGH